MPVSVHGLDADPLAMQFRGRVWSSAFLRVAFHGLAPVIDPPKFIVAVDPAVPPPGLVDAVAAIGNFDGVHRGHVAVIERAKALAQKLGRPCIVLTFEPHPTDLFKGPNTIFRLTPRGTKAKILERLGIDGMIVMTFDKALARLPAETFIA